LLSDIGRVAARPVAKPQFEEDYNPTQLESVPRDGFAAQADLE